MPRPVLRIGWIAAQAAGRRVLDLGAYDEKSLIKQETPFWLHRKLAETAASVIGIDSSDKLPPEGLVTSGCSRILRGDIFNLKEAAQRHEIDLIVAGEVVEHIPNALDFLKYLKSVKEFQEKRLILTTPNATAWHNIFLGLWSRESCHEDHLQVYSYKTLNTLCARAGFREWKMIPYYSLFSELLLRARGILRAGVMLSEKITQAIEWAVPLWSGGWIVDVTI